ncbi:MAG: D-xylose transport system substrate-binding protein [Psychromonas sp.]|jgi:D-xylose transport system substrate-binding protein|uniref:sugar ABC transporter substrate-binding protein n=1 Tax=Psychromonas sp. TaxID=1884585 RepID=UPI0039E4C1AA
MTKLTIKIFFLFGVLFLQGCTDVVLPKVGLSLPNQRVERWVRDKEAMQIEAQKSDIDLQVLVSDNDAATQIQQCEALLAQGIKLLILVPYDASSAATIVELAHKQGVPVISYDRLVLNADVDLYLSFDNEEVGRIQARYLLEQAPKGKYIVLAGSPTDNNAKMYRAGAMELLQPEIDNKNIELLLDTTVMDWKPIEAYRLVKEELSQLSSQGNLKQLSAVLAPNDNTARGVITALAEAGLDGQQVVVTGQDGGIESSKLIVSGKQGMTVFKDTRLLSKKAIEMSVKILNGEQLSVTSHVNNGLFDVKSILLKPTLVTKNNLDQIFIDSGYIRRQDIYGIE